MVSEHTAYVEGVPWIVDVFTVAVGRLRMRG